MSKYRLGSPLPPQQARVLGFVMGEVDAGHGFPEPAVIAAHMGWKKHQSAIDCLHRLRWRGFVTRDERDLEVVAPREDLLQLEPRVDAAEPAAQDQDATGRPHEVEPGEVGATASIGWRHLHMGCSGPFDAVEVAAVSAGRRPCSLSPTGATRCHMSLLPRIRLRGHRAPSYEVATAKAVR